MAETPYLTRLSLQPEFLPRSDDHYHVDDLLKYHDSQFIGNAYRALLRREPDEPGLNTYLDKLRSGRFNKIDVLANIRFSEEGRRNNVPVDGLRGRAAIRRCYRLPLLGYLIELAVGIIRTAVHFNNTVDAFAQHIDATNQALRHDTRNLREAVTRLNESLSSSFSRLTNEQKRFARLQHQQLSALFLMQQNAESGSSNGNRSDVKNHFDQDRPSGGLGNLDEIYANFQRQFRGDFNAVKESLKVYLPLLSETAIKEGILDLGCGRGEWLQLLQEAGLQARGIESNKVLATQARGRNLEVIVSDALLYLRRLPEDSLNAVTAFHFIEHVGFEELIELLGEISRTLTPGGLLIIETPNPKNLVVGACNFYSDPTHRQPLFPETLEFLIQQFRFARTHIRYLHPVEASPFTSKDAAQQALNSWFFSGRDYSLVGWNS